MKNLLALLCVLMAFTALQAQDIITVAGNGTAGFSGDGGAATAAKMNEPFNICFDAAGNMYLSDYFNSRIRKVDPFGTITTAAGSNMPGYSGDGGQATAAKLYQPVGVIIDVHNNLIISDYDNHVIRKVTPAGIISTIAGNHIAGYGGDGGPATSAQFNFPSGIGLDNAENLYIADFLNNCIRVLSLAGVVTTFAGDGTMAFGGDGGPATAAQIYYPAAVAVDASGNVFIADCFNNRIRKVDASGIISTVAGNGTGGYGGDGGPATDAMIKHPQGIAVDADGTLYIGDLQNNRLRKVSPAGIITTVAGMGTPGFSGDGGHATAALVHSPAGVTISPSGVVYFGDVGNQRVRALVCTVMEVPAPAGPDTVCIGDTIMLTDSMAGGTWTASNSHATVADSVVTGVSVGLDTVLYLVSTSCGTGFNSKEIYVKSCVDGTLRQHNTNAMQAISIAPNPGHEGVVITSGSSLGEVIIFDLLGRVYKRETTSANNLSVDVSAWPAGIYLVHLRGKVRRFLKAEN